MAVRVAINGFGRTGRAVLRAAMKSPHDIEVAAVNDLGDPEALARLLARDSVHGHFPEPVTFEHDKMMVGRHGGHHADGAEPRALPWRELGIDVVIECTGRLTSRDKAAAHLQAGARRVIISAPAKGVDATFVVGVNEDDLRPGAGFRGLQRVVHDELPRRPGQGARRCLRDRGGLHDDGPRLHGRPASRRRSPQGPAPGSRRRHQHHPDHDRCRSGHRAGAPRRRRSPRRALAPGAGA